MDGTKDFFSNYSVSRIPMKIAKEYIIEHHYTHGCHNAPSPCYGLFNGGSLIGVLMFAVPCSENVRSSLWGKEHKNAVLELHRLHILDITPRNTETWFMARCFELLKQDRPEIKGIISFADSTEGHSGTIYKAMNFYFVGKTSGTWFYLDQDGRLRHPRQNGVNISNEQAKSMGWTRVRRGAKNRYIYFLPTSKKEKKELISACLYDVQHFVWCPICGKKRPIGTLCQCQCNSINNV